MHRILHTFKLIATVILIVVACIACDHKLNTAKSTIEQQAGAINLSLPLMLKVDDASAINIADKLWQKSQQHLNITHTKAVDLQEAIKNLLATPDKGSLTLAQQQWRLTMVAYQQLSPLLYLENKNLGHKEIDNIETEHRKAEYIKDSGDKNAHQDNTNNFMGINQWRKKIAAWPIQPGYLDSFGPHIHSGIVNDITLSIDSYTLRSQHLMTSSEEATLGLYAIEYLLFGDKEYKNERNTNFKRFLKVAELPKSLAQAGLTINELPNNRRRALIELQTRLLVNDIHTLIGLHQTNGALSIAFQKLPTLKKLYAFQLSVNNSLQNSLKLFSYYDEGLTSEKESTTSIADNIDSDAKTADEKRINIKKTDTQDTFTKRFINNRNLAFKNNLKTIKSIYMNDNTVQEATEKSAQKAINASTLSMALLSTKDKNIVIELLEGIEKEVAKKDYKVEKVKFKIKTISAILSI
jgi:hypothetical protein